MTTPQPNAGYFDLAGVSKVQQNYLLDLSNSYPNVNNAATVASYVNELQNQMKGLSQSYVDANTSGAAVLDQQNKMIEIVDAEHQRLLQKKYLMDQAASQQDRIALLNNSYRLRYAQYTKIVIVIIIGLCIHIVLRLIGSYFTQVPTLPLVLLHIVNIVVCLIIVTYIYADAQMRDQIDFNQLNIPPPNTTGTPAVSSSPSTGNFWGDLGICYGESCCGPNTVWNQNTGTCDVVASPSAGPTVGPNAGPTVGPIATVGPNTGLNASPNASTSATVGPTTNPALLFNQVQLTKPPSPAQSSLYVVPTTMPATMPMPSPTLSTAASLLSASASSLAQVSTPMSASIKVPVSASPTASIKVPVSASPTASIKVPVSASPTASIKVPVSAPVVEPFTVVKIKPFSPSNPFSLVSSKSTNQQPTNPLLPSQYGNLLTKPSLPGRDNHAQYGIYK